MSELRAPNVDEIKRQSVVRFLAEMQDLKQRIELEFSSRFDEQKNNFLATSKASYLPSDVGNIFDTIKSLELDFMKNILTNASGNGSKILSNTLSSALTGNLTFSGEATQRIAELEQENNRLKVELIEKEKIFESERSKIKERGEDQIGEMNRLQELVDEQKRTIEMYENQAMEHGETLAQQRIEIEDLQSQFGEFSQNNENLTKLLQERDDTIADQISTIESLQEQMASMDKRIQQMKSVSTEKFEAQTSRLEETLNLERERADDLEVRLKEATTAITNYKNSIQLKDEEIDKLRKTVTETKSDIASASTEKDAKIKQLQDDYKSLEHQFTDIKSTFDRAEKKIENLEKQLAEKEKAMDEKDSEIRGLKDQLSDAKDSVITEKSSQESRINELLKDKTNYEAEINLLKKEMREIKAAFEDKEKTINEITKTQDVIEKDRDAVQDERDKILVQMENLKQRNLELEKSIGQKDTLVKSLTQSSQNIPKFRVFLAIQDIGGELPVKDLAKIVGQSADVVDHIVTELKEDGLVKVTKKENKTFVAKV
ncbi:MAG: hypothetical protein ACFFDW_07875 [Candidatus Thorarchaeota archaeon]